MSRYIISPGQGYETASTHSTEPVLRICELFTDAFQGEGVYTGHPAIFLRLAGCHLNCKWCDTKDIWQSSTTLSVDSLISLFIRESLVDKLSRGFHLVITGGSPLLQQDSLTKFIVGLRKCAENIFIEMENDASLTITPQNEALLALVDCWNNSPKLASSGIPLERRYNPKAILQLGRAGTEHWFKFVISKEEEWNEIEELFLGPSLIKREKIILMPQGQTIRELTPQVKRKIAELAVGKGVRFSTRLHIDLYDDLKGV
ncbi:MAG: 7-carboxy-7-deazaguanine synthase QueE [Candidatus Coprenecus sp.]|nr:7-carboxy-7-deazaguanine synthase QueE [Candidatus Coprenecus sp.]